MTHRSRASAHRLTEHADHYEPAALARIEPELVTVAKVGPTYDLAARLRSWRVTAVCLCHSSDVPVVLFAPEIRKIAGRNDVRLFNQSMRS